MRPFETGREDKQAAGEDGAGPGSSIDKFSELFVIRDFFEIPVDLCLFLETGIDLYGFLEFGERFIYLSLE